MFFVLKTELYFYFNHNYLPMYTITNSCNPVSCKWQLAVVVSLHAYVTTCLCTIILIQNDIYCARVVNVSVYSLCGDAVDTLATNVVAPKKLHLRVKETALGLRTNPAPLLNENIIMSEPQIVQSFIGISKCDCFKHFPLSSRKCWQIN